MKYGHLTVVCGPMFAGKTTELLKRVLWAQNGEGKRTAVFKSAYDIRYSVAEIVSHDGLQTRASIIRAWPGVLNINHVFFDEVQFFTEPHFAGDIVEVILELLKSGIDVTATGLDTDWQGRAFDTTAMLMAMADTVVKNRSHCAVCGRPATKTFKRVPNMRSIEVGGTDLYEPRCNEHWSSHMEQTLFDDVEKALP